MGRIEDSAKCVALALLNFADDEGYFLAEPNLVRSSCRPFDDDSTIIRRSLDLLREAGWIEVRNHPSHGPIGRIVNFTEHQKIDRPKSSGLSGYFACEESTNDRRTIAAGKEGKGKEGNGTVTPRSKRGGWGDAHPEPVVSLTMEIMGFWPSPPHDLQPPDGKGQRQPVPKAKAPELAQRLAEIHSTGADLDICRVIAQRAVQEWREGSWIKAPQHFFGRSEDAPCRAYYKAEVTNRRMAQGGAA